MLRELPGWQKRKEFLPKDTIMESTTTTLEELVTGYPYQFCSYWWCDDMRYPDLTDEDYHSVVVAPTEKVEGILKRLRDAAVEAGESIRQPVDVPWHGIQEGVFKRDDEKCARDFILIALGLLLVTLVWGTATHFGLLGYLTIAFSALLLLMGAHDVPSPWNTKAYERVEREQRQKEWLNECIARSGLPVEYGLYTFGLNDWKWRIDGREVQIESIRLQVFRGDSDLENFVYRLERVLNHYYGKIVSGKEYCYMDRAAMRRQG